MEIKATVRWNTTFIIQSSLKKLNKRAKKLGVAEVELIQGEPYNKTWKRYNRGHSFSRMWP